MKLTSQEKKRLKHINTLMDNLHGDLDDIYESLADRDIRSCKCSVESLIKKLKSLSNTLDDE